MRQASLCLALAFSLLLATSAAADLHVWWEGEQVGGTGEVFGGMGETLELECEVGTRCEWNLTMYIALDTSADQVLQWGEDLLIDPSLGGNVTVSNNRMPDINYWSRDCHQGYANYGYFFPYYHLLLYSHGLANDLSPVKGPLLTPLLHLMLSVNTMPGPAGSSIEILSESNSFCWARGLSYSVWYGDFFGHMDQMRWQSYGDIRTNAAIRINAIPEPSTVAFLGVAALPLIRRRR